MSLMSSNLFSIVDTPYIGSGTRIWAFVHILSGARIGADCNICDHVFIEGDVVVGDRVTIKSGVQLWDGVTLGDDVFVGPNASFTNDPFPRSRRYQERVARTTVKDGASIGANATILPGVTIGERAMVGAAAVVTRDVPANTIVVGNPARIVGYVGATPSLSSSSTHAGPGPAEPGCEATTVRGVTLHRLPGAEDLRGRISFGETERHIPFAVRRHFVVYGVPGENIRGEHAHRNLHQFLICVAGSVRAVADDGTNREEFLLDDPAVGLHLPPMIWGVQYRYSAGAVLLVLASDYYDPLDYIRDYTEFLHLTAKTR
jgi:UDP-2-acetamido-3-amino-2,3-dideoxy-glucuronate N-acetyltransferase